MFAKFKSSTQTPNVLESNPISNCFEVGKQTGTAGPEHVWKIHDGYRKNDGKEVSIFIFDKRSVEKLHKPKRKEAITEGLRAGVRHLELFQHPKTLQIIHGVEECPETLAFASEPVLASLANVLYAQEKRAIALAQSSSTINHQQNATAQGHRPVYAKEYDMLDIEIKYGLLQIMEALAFLHHNRDVLHRNVCPSSIIITKRGTWKLAGFEFAQTIERTKDRDELQWVATPAWTNKMSKMTQPNLDFIAPEVQQKKVASMLSDMFSFGMVICSIFNQGRPLLQSNHSTSDYLRQLDTLEDQVRIILPRIPVPLQEAVSRLLQKDPLQRPNAKLLSLIKYFSDPPVHALQFLDVINRKDPMQKGHFYRSTLKEALPYIPKKLWYQHIWPSLESESRSQEVFSAVLQPMLYIIQESTPEEYEKILLPSFRTLLTSPKSIQGTVILLENLHVILDKTPHDIRPEIMRILYTSFDSSTIQVTTATFVAISNVTGYLDDKVIQRTVLQKLKQAFETNTTDARILMNVLTCILDRLDKQQIIDDVLPLLWDVRLQDPEILIRVVNIYRLMLSDKKYGLSINLMATRVMPSLLPQTVNPSLNLEQFTILMEVLQEMLNLIERNQRNKLKLDNLSLPSPERHRPLRHQFSTDNMHVPAFNIPGVRIDQRKTSSAEDMARKSSTGSISITASAENVVRKTSVSTILGGFWFPSSSANDNSNLLRVNPSFTTRRLSDNTLLTPKIRLPPSCASSPGGTPGGGLPTRRHSSTGQQERRGSNMNLSPPTGMPITSSSVPYLLSSSMNSIRSSRRPSISSTSSTPGSGLLQQFGSGMVRQLPPICLNLNGPPPPPTLSPSLQPSGQPSH